MSDRETNTRLCMYSQMSTNPENLVKILVVDSEISLLQAIVKKEEIKKKMMMKKKATPVKHKLARPACSVSG